VTKGEEEIGRVAGQIRLVDGRRSCREMKVTIDGLGKPLEGESRWLYCYCDGRKEQMKWGCQDAEVTVNH
jgi:hypothetical protein